MLAGPRLDLPQMHGGMLQQLHEGAIDVDAEEDSVPGAGGDDVIAALQEVCAGNADVIRLTAAAFPMDADAEMAEEQAELMKKNVKWVKSMARLSTLQNQYEMSLCGSSMTVFMKRAWET